VTLLIEDYALIGNCETAALVGRNGSIDWLGLPRFDSAACFAALVGTPENGRWLIAPVDAEVAATRSYLGDTLILETTFTTGTGAVSIIDFMARREGTAELVRQVRGIRGSVAMHSELIVRFDYGSVVPWVSRQADGRMQIVAGPDRLMFEASVALHGKDMRTVAKFEVHADEQVDFCLSWNPSFQPCPPPFDLAAAREHVAAFWQEWTEQSNAPKAVDGAVMRSLLTLKALTHFQTGGIVAAPTTSLPEQVGGPRNWDYRYCWLRDATLTLYALMQSGFLEEAKTWREWLLRAIAGSPDKLQIMYGVAGERRLTEYEVPWLAGYEGSRPVRIGNAAHGQLQLDVYGEVLDALYAGRRLGLAENASSWALECNLLAHLGTLWDQPDDGIWEVRGKRQNFTHSKVMAWVAYDRAIRSAEEFGLDGPVDEWKHVRTRIHDQVCAQGFDQAMNSFVQAYGSKQMDASLLMIPLVGFLPAGDRRVIGTVAAIEKHLLRDGFVLRYDTGPGADGLPPGEGAFLACSFWLADVYVLQGRTRDAQALFDKLLALRNDLGLLAEEYDHVSKRQVGNFPQAFSHLALIGTAHSLSGAGPAHQRASAYSHAKSQE